MKPPRLCLFFLVICFLGIPLSSYAQLECGGLICGGGGGSGGGSGGGADAGGYGPVAPTFKVCVPFETSPGAGFLCKTASSPSEACNLSVPDITNSVLCNSVDPYHDDATTSFAFSFANNTCTLETTWHPYCREGTSDYYPGGNDTVEVGYATECSENYSLNNDQTLCLPVNNPDDDSGRTCPSVP